MINPVAFEIGPFAIRWYALCIVCLLYTSDAADERG